MVIVGFPDVTIADENINALEGELLGTTNPFYPGVLCVPIAGPRESIYTVVAQLIPMITETSEKNFGEYLLAGGTSEIIASGLEAWYEHNKLDEKPVDPYTVAHAILGQMVEKGHMYGVLLPEGFTEEGHDAEVITSETVREDLLADEETIDRLVWIPSDYTADQYLWKLEFSKEQLAHYKVLAE